MRLSCLPLKDASCNEANEKTKRSVSLFPCMSPLLFSPHRSFPSQLFPFFPVPLSNSSLLFPSLLSLPLPSPSQLSSFSSSSQLLLSIPFSFRPLPYSSLRFSSRIPLPDAREETEPSARLASERLLLEQTDSLSQYLRIVRNKQKKTSQRR